MNPDHISRVSVDLGATIPEYNGALNKVDFGTYDSPTSRRAALPYRSLWCPRGGYDKTAYEAGSGVVDIPRPAS